MQLQVITYRGGVVAACTPTHFCLTDELERRPPTDPERTFVRFMCAYACAVLCGELPGPYCDSDARLFARCALIPLEVVERDDLDLARLAAWLRVPAAELLAARAEYLSQRRFDDRLRRSPN
jgi:hypothetical protein